MGEKLQHVSLGFLILFLHRIAIFSSAQMRCNRTCGSTTVKYPFGFSGDCPYTLDKDCSANGQVYLNGYKVLDFTSESIIIDPWSLNHNATKCYQELGKLPDFKQQFCLTGRNVLIMGPNCKEPDCNFSIATLLDLVSKDGSGRTNCSGDYLTNFTCISKIGMEWLPWNIVEGSKCKGLVSGIIYEPGMENGTGSFTVNKIELGWWVNGTCHSNSCSANANCSHFKNPNTNETVHRCFCNQGFVGDGFLEGSGCTNDSGCNASRYLSGKCGNGSRAVVSICSLIAVAVVVLVIVLSYKRSASALKKRSSVKRLLSGRGGTSALAIPIYSYRELEKATKGFSEKERLGSGAFGTVYAGKLPSKRFVAVKKMRRVDSTDGMERVLNEINVLSSVDHPNLLRLLGCCLEERGEPILVYEYMPNGTLFEHLQRERGEGLPWATRINIAAETARALAYLHSAVNPPIYHRDIKSSNILLDYGFNSKVADFGLSRLVLSERSHISTTPQGTPGYLDPQYHQNFHLSDKSDVYSFGVVLVEILSALKVVDFSRDMSEINLARLAVNKIGAGRVDEMVDPFLGVEKDSVVRAYVHRVAEVAFRCLAFDKDARPTMTEVSEELDSIAEDSKISMNVVQSADESKRPAVYKSSPASVQDPWFSSQSSLSSNSIL